MSKIYTRKSSYLSYIEETPKWRTKLVRVAKKASQHAIEDAKEKGLDITYVQGMDIIKETAAGVKTVIGQVEAEPKKVNKDRTFELS